MDASAWMSLKWVFGGLAAIAAIVGALVQLYGKAQNATAHDAVRNWFAAKWSAIGQSRWLSMPTQVIEWFVALKSDLTTRIHRINLDRWGDWWQGATVFGALALCVGFLSWNVAWWAGPLLILMIFVAGLLCLGDIAVLLVLASSALILVWAAVHLPLRIAALAAWLTLPFLMISAGYLLVLLCIIPLALARALRREPMLYGEDILLLGMAVGASVAITLLALVVGSFAKPTSWVPQTIQMFASNMIFDGMTIFFTYWLLSWAIKKPSRLRIPVAVTVDLLLSGAFACTSLWLGLAGTDHSVSIREAINVLVARAPDGSRVDIGPYFWVMHTVFIPTLLFLLTVLICWLAKLLLAPARWFLGRGSGVERPLEFAAALCAVFVASFAALAYLCSTLQEAAASVP